MTIMTESNSEGTRRCDANCHAAKRPKYTCICGGRYHGVGKSETVQVMLTRDILGEDWQNQKARGEAEGSTVGGVSGSPAPTSG